MEEIGTTGDKAEMPGNSAKRGGVVGKAELFTNANRHELDARQPPCSIHGRAELLGSDVVSDQGG